MLETQIASRTRSTFERKYRCMNVRGGTRLKSKLYVSTQRRLSTLVRQPFCCGLNDDVENDNDDGVDKKTTRQRLLRDSSRAVTVD